MQWNRMNAEKTCSVMLSRAQDGWLPLHRRNIFRPAARLPHLLLRDLVLGHAQGGEVDQHDTVCRELRLARVADRNECQVSVGLPSHLDKEYLGTAPDITHFVDKPVPQCAPPWEDHHLPDTQHHLPADEEGGPHHA